MNVASLELNRELYEVSGWHDTHQYGYFKNDNKSNYAIQYQFNKGNRPGWWWYEGISAWPAFDLGYLLRKLPPERKSKMGNEIQMILRYDNGKWLAEYTDGDFIVLEADLIGETDTPENAVVKLAIQLFKTGVLTRGEQ